MISTKVGIRSTGAARRLIAGIGILAATAMTSPVPGIAETPPAPANVQVSLPQAATQSPLTLQDVVRMVLDHNSAIVIARERLKKAGEQVGQVDAQARPQIHADIADTLSSQRSFSASGGSAIAPALPGGGQIPTVIDQGGGNLGTFIGGGGGGTAPSTNTGASMSPTSQTSPTGPTGQNGATSPAPSTSTSGTLAPHATEVGGQTFTGGNFNNYAARISLSQYIDIYSLVPTARDITKITRDYYILDLDRQSNELALSTKTAFFNALRGKAAVDVQTEQVASARESLRIAEARFNAGAAPQFDVVTAQTALASAEQQLSSARNQLDLANANLNNLIGSSLDTPLTLAVPAISTDESIDLDKAVSAANAGRPELKQAENNLVIANKLIKIAGAAMKPSLGITGSANYSGTAIPGSPQDTYSITADLGVPLYDGGETRSRVRTAESDLAVQRVTRDQLKQNIALEVRQAYLNINDAKARIASATVGATQAAEALRLANVRYQNGIGTFLEVTNAQSQLATARLNLTTAQYDFETALAQLARAEGTR